MRPQRTSEFLGCPVKPLDDNGASLSWPSQYDTIIFDFIDEHHLSLEDIAHPEIDISNLVYSLKANGYEPALQTVVEQCIKQRAAHLLKDTETVPVNKSLDLFRSTVVKVDLDTRRLRNLITAQENQLNDIKSLLVLVLDNQLAAFNSFSDLANTLAGDEEAAVTLDAFNRWMKDFRDGIGGSIRDLKDELSDDRATLWQSRPENKSAGAISRSTAREGLGETY